ncbi:MAG: ATP-grasp domain-containing protein [Spirochaetia bacterium]
MSGADEKTIAILGGGIMQLPSLRIARELGWRVILIDGSSKVPGREYADFFEHIDLKHKEEITGVLERYARENGLDGVFTAGTDFSTSVAYAAERLGLPGIPYEVALDATDKGRMREVFKANHVPSPDFRCITAETRLAELEGELRFPVVVKPADNMGARGVVKAESPDQLRQAVSRGFMYSRSHKVIIEEYVEGPEFSLDAIVYKGEITVCGVADRDIRFPPYFVEMGHTMPTAYNRATVSAVEKVFCQGIKALGITNGAAKGDIKLSGQGPVVGEIAARLSGGYMSGWTFPYAYGVRVTEAAMRIAVGLPPFSLEPNYHCVSAERAFISIPGEIRAIYGTDEAGNLPGVMDLFLRVAPGSKVCFPRNNVEKCGNIISKAGDRRRAVAAAQDALRRIFLRLKADRPETDEFLLGNGTPGVACFIIEDRTNREALTRMRPLWNDMPGRVPEKMAILALPVFEREHAHDWHGLPIGKALEMVTRYTGVHLTAAVTDNMIVLGRLVWDAFCRGGIQGGVYVIDTLLKKRRKGAADEKAY